MIIQPCLLPGLYMKWCAVQTSPVCQAVKAQANSTAACSSLFCHLKVLISNDLISKIGFLSLSIKSEFCSKCVMVSVLSGELT